MERKKYNDTGPPSARLKEVEIELEAGIDADTNVPAKEEQPRPARRERSEKR